MLWLRDWPLIRRYMAFYGDFQMQQIDLYHICVYIYFLHISTKNEYANKCSDGMFCQIYAITSLTSEKNSLTILLT